MTSKYELTRAFNDEARREIEASGSPSYVDPDGKRFSSFGSYDADEIWGVPNHEMAELVASMKRRWHATPIWRVKERRQWKQKRTIAGIVARLDARRGRAHARDGG